MIKCLVEIEVLIKPLSEISKPFITFTPKNIIFCFIKLLAQQFNLNIGKIKT